ncbi:MAG: hypothetical protein HDR88_10245 [Bacteroides sp.]|nr:hypothetical protein [Bacteroides sp.]
MEQLNLHTNKKHFQALLKGDVLVEKRYVYPNNVKKYVIEEDKTDENGEEITVVTPVHYDTLQFICGHKKDAPCLIVEVKSSEFVVLTDENGNDMTFEENGTEYYVCQVWYTLGDIIATENISE